MQKITDHEKRVAAAQASLQQAERERAETAEKLTTAEANLRETETEYDREPDDDNGQRVIQARQARDLAGLRSERAQRREAESRQALDSAQAELRRAQIEHDLVEARAREAASRSQEAEALAVASAPSTAEAIKQVLAFAAERDAQAAAELAAARHEAAEAARVVAELEAALAEAAPDLRPVLADAAEARVRQERARAEAAASAATMCQKIQPRAAAILHCERMIQELAAQIEGAVAEQREAAARARALGSDVEDAHDAHKTVHVEVARFRALSAEQQLAEAKAGRDLLSRVRRLFGDDALFAWSLPYTAARGYLSCDEQIGAYLQSLRGASKRTLRALAHRRALDAGDVNALAYEQREAAARAQDPHRSGAPDIGHGVTVHNYASHPEGHPWGQSYEGERGVDQTYTRLDAHN